MIDPKHLENMMNDLVAEDAKILESYKLNIPAGNTTVIREYRSKDETTALARILSTVTSGVTKTRIGNDGKRELYTSYEIDTQKLTLHIADHFQTISVASMNRDEPVIWVWDDQKKIYTKDIGAIHRHITDLCRLNNTQKQRPIILEVMDMLSGTNFFTESPFNRSLGIPFENGIVYLHEKTHEITGPHPHTPESMFTYCLPTVFDKTADTGQVMNVLKEWVEEKDIPILLQHVALGFIQAQRDQTFKKSLLIYGEGNGGKSSFLELNYRAFGKFSGALGGTSLHSIVNDQFALGSLENTILNIFDELDGPELNGWESFKRLVGSTLHTIHEKHKPDHRARIYCSHIFACNSPPPVPERARYDGAFWNRWSLVKFPYEHDVDPAWMDKTFTPKFLSGYMNLILEKIMEIEQIGKLTKTMDSEEVMDRWYQSSDPLAMYLDETFTSDDIYGKPITKLYHYSKNKMFKGYQTCCKEHRIDEKKIIKTLTEFTRKIQKFGFLPGRTIVLVDAQKKEKAQVSCYSAYKITVSDVGYVASRDDWDQKNVDQE